MGLKLSAAWFIDGCRCVLDGLAFASLRKPRNSAAATLVEPVTTVLIGPPDWRAVSISRLPTALAATRGPFQEGVLDDDGRGIAFPRRWKPSAGRSGGPTSLAGSASTRPEGPSHQPPSCRDRRLVALPQPACGASGTPSSTPTL